MELGAKIKAARLEAGLSQRQLCGQQLTRNMLSQIENGSARPSMKTLTYLAQVLGKSVSYFLEETAVTSPNLEAVTQARLALALGDLEAMRQALDGFREPDGVFIEEYRLLEFRWHEAKGRKALEQGMEPYGVKLLRRALELEGLYITARDREACRVGLALAGQPETPAGVDEALLALAIAATEPRRQLEILGAVEDREDPRWQLAWGKALYAQGSYAQARQTLEAAPQTRQVLSLLEDCCREQGDFQGAYHYACLLRK